MIDIFRKFYLFPLTLIFLVFNCSGGDSDSTNTNATNEITNPPAIDDGSGVFFIGHSQVNHQMPGYFKWLVESNDNEIDVERQVIGGGNLEENFILHAQTSDSQDSGIDPDGKYFYFPGRISDKGVDSLLHLDTGAYGHLVITEEHGLTQAQARDSQLQDKYDFSFPEAENVSSSGDNYLLSLYQKTSGIASGLGFYHKAISANSEAQVYLYENWFPPVNGSTQCTRLEANQTTKNLVELNSWRKRILAYKPAWEAIAEEINGQMGEDVSGWSYGSTIIEDTTIATGADVQVIPVAQALSVLVEQICQGNVNGIINPNEVFLDHAHASILGNYFISLIMYGAIYNESPAGITLSGSSIGKALDGSNLLDFDQNTINDLQTIAWNVLSGTLVANDSEIQSCEGLSNVHVYEEQICIGADDDEEIPSY